MGKYNWEEIKSQIELGMYSLKEIAKKHQPKGTNFKNVYDYIRQKKKQEGWEKEEETYKEYTKKVKSKLVEEEADKEAELRKEHDKMITNIRRSAYRTLMDERNTDRLRQYKLAINIIAECRKEQWEINEIQEVAKKIEQEIDITELPDVNLVRGDKGDS